MSKTYFLARTIRALDIVLHQHKRVWLPIMEKNVVRCFWRLKCCHATCGQRLRGPPQQLLVMATALSLAAVVVFVMIATGDLPWGKGRGGRCDSKQI